MTRPFAIVLALVFACASHAETPPSSHAPSEPPMAANPPPPPPRPGPPPPPSAKGPVDPASPEGRYLAWATAQGAAAPVAVAWRPGATGEWAFFFTQGAPGQKLHPAAVGPKGVVRAGEPTGWAELLRSAPAGEVQERVAWLSGAWASVAPGTPMAASVAQKHPKSAPLLAAPTLVDAKGQVVFTAWYAEPPGMLPFRLTVTATDTTATFDRATLASLAP